MTKAPTSQSADREADERKRRDAQREGDSAGDLGAVIAQACMDFFKALLPDWLFQFIFENDPDAPNEHQEDMVDATPEEKKTQAQAFSSKGKAAWQKLKDEYAGGEITHSAPVENERRTSKYGMRIHPISGEEKMHGGIDFGGGGSIRASAEGVVLFAGRKSGYGNTVILGHADGSRTLYAHMTGAQMPEVGARVDKSEVIGVMGKTGLSTGVHLHYEQFDKNGKRHAPVINGVARSEHDHDHEKPSPAKSAGQELKATGTRLSESGEVAKLGTFGGIARLNIVQRS